MTWFLWVLRNFRRITLHYVLLTHVSLLSIAALEYDFSMMQTFSEGEFHGFAYIYMKLLLQPPDNYAVCCSEFCSVITIVHETLCSVLSGIHQIFHFTFQLATFLTALLYVTTLMVDLL